MSSTSKYVRGPRLPDSWLIAAPLDSSIRVMWYSLGPG
jgi:hypothetical protein